MTQVLYVVERGFMRKTFESIDDHLDLDTAYVPVRPEARGCLEGVREVSVEDVRDVDANVRAVDPDVVVYNHQFRIDEIEFHEEYPLVHVRHGASIGRGIERAPAEKAGHAAAVFLVPGERWAREYREVTADDVRVETVGIPEADDLVAAEAPRKRRVLYAPTNHNYGSGSFLNTATDVLDLFADTDYDLLFRPHPMDRKEEPGRSLTERCRERIAGIPNVEFDEGTTPRESMLWADLLLSDYSGIIAEWLHTRRPLIQFSDVTGERDVPAIGHVTASAALDLETVGELYARGYSDRVAARERAFREDLGVPMDGRAGERAAREVAACTQ